MDPFTRKRITRFVENFRAESGQLPSLSDFEKAGFEKKWVELAVKEELLEQFYVTLTNGTIIKTFKIRLSH